MTKTTQLKKKKKLLSSQKTIRNCSSEQVQKKRSNPRFERFLRSEFSFILIAILCSGIFFLCFPIGLVGEVTPMWANPPRVLASTTPIQDSILAEFGALQLRATRPILSFSGIPISLNTYTSAIPDWPHFLVYRLSQSPFAIQLSQLFFTLGFLFLLQRKLRPLLSQPWTLLFLFLLISDWNFLFYKKALGNTEILLQFSWILCICAFHQWQKKDDGSSLLGWGIGLGFLAKITFVLNLLPITLGLLLIRPKQISWKKIFLPITLCALPFLLTIALFWGQEFPIRSHDFFTLQWERVQQALSGKNSSIREQHNNLWLWLLDPLPFIQQAYKVPNISPHWLLKGSGLLMTLGLFWRKRNNRMLRFLGTITLTQILVLSFIAKDLHHLAMATPLFWLLLVFLWKENVDLGWKLSIYILPFLGGNAQILLDSPTHLSAVQTPSFSAESQQNIVNLLRQHQVQQLLTMDYEIYGVLEALSPEIAVTHGWGAISHERGKALPKLLQEAEGGHLVVLRSSSGMIYNLRPSTQKLAQLAQPLGLKIELVDTWTDRLWLYSVKARIKPVSN